MDHSGGLHAVLNLQLWVLLQQYQGDPMGYWFPTPPKPAVFLSDHSSQVERLQVVTSLTTERLLVES